VVHARQERVPRSDAEVRHQGDVEALAAQQAVVGQLVCHQHCRGDACSRRVRSLLGAGDNHASRRAGVRCSPFRISRHKFVAFHWYSYFNHPSVPITLIEA
jgi:hypothetical protein